MPTINGTSGSDTLTGTSENDVINGLEGDDVLDGGGGSDTLDGGAGADIMRNGAVFYVDNPGDLLEFSGSARIFVSSLDFSIRRQVRSGTSLYQAEAVSGTAPIKLSGSYVDDVLTGNDGANVLDALPNLQTRGYDTLRGLGGDDTYIVYHTPNLVFEEAGQGFDTVLVAIDPQYTFSNYSLLEPRGRTGTEQSVEVLAMADPAGTQAFQLTGNSVAQLIRGNAGANSLIGAGGADTLVGLAGDDTYSVEVGTTIREEAGQGFDTVIVGSTLVSGAAYALPAGMSIEAISLVGSPLGGSIIGNELSQRITGNNGNNVLNGGGATTGAGDTLVGLGGNDTYLVQGQGDMVIEENGGGLDTVYTTVSYNLGANEVEVLSTVEHMATDAIHLIGNYASQRVIGNYGDNILNGGSGVDTLIGLRGNDLYAVADGRIIIQENAGEGDDTVVTSVDYTLGSSVSVEVLAAQDRASTAGLKLVGNDIGQTIAGTAGADTLNGAGGADVLIGGGGNDRFDFTVALGVGNVDTITDFAADDRIGLSSTVFTGVGASLEASEFVTGSVAADADDRIVYNQATGQVFYDADGNGVGAATLFAQLTPGTALASANFEVIAPA